MEQLVLVCDDCGRPAVTIATIKLNGNKTSLQKDLCKAHAATITAGAHKARRGRPKAVYA